MPKLRIERVTRLGTALFLALLLAACGTGTGTGTASNTEPELVAHDDAPTAGLADHTRTHGDDCVADINRDGRLDVLLNSHTDQWQLMYGNANGTFTRAMVFPLRDRHGCAVADFNGDGRPDIYFAIGACVGKCKAPKELLIQQRDHSFVNEATAWGVDDPGGRGRVPIAVNANGDKRPDLFTGQEIGVDFPSLNRLWINAKNRFVLEPGPPTAEIGNNCAVAVDLTHDGLDDLAVCTPSKGFYVYRAVGGGRYAESTKAFGISKHGRRAARFADVNHDGWPDFVSVTSTSVQVFLNDHGRFHKAAFSLHVTDARDVAVGDADGDGNVDLYVQRYEHRDQIYLGDGRGDFAAGPVVPKRNGVAESVTVLPHWRNGRDAFIVGNGYQETKGTRQLIAVDGTRSR